MEETNYRDKAIEELAKKLYPIIRTRKRESQMTLAAYTPKPFGEKRTYSQNWPAYDQAKTNEDVLFKRLLDELLFLATEEKPYKRGRRGYSTRDKIFCMAIKIYYRSDLRKAQSILKEMQNLHLIRKVPCFKSIDNFFNDPSLSEVLDKLILLTALPLAKLEETGAIDATGFSMNQFQNWNSYKWGKSQGKERIWRKAHACVGCKTNIFLSIKVTKQNVHDLKMVEEVIGAKTKYFDMEEFVADKAYSTRAVFKFLHDLGLTPYIPFKKNAIGTPKGVSIWRTMYDLFHTYRSVYDMHYHTRSNIETSFSMLKQRFGGHLMTKKFIANTNEIKTKALCHNLCVLITETFESDISVDFESCVKKATGCVL